MIFSSHLRLGRSGQSHMPCCAFLQRSQWPRPCTSAFPLSLPQPGSPLMAWGSLFSRWRIPRRVGMAETVLEACPPPSCYRPVFKGGFKQEKTPGIKQRFQPVGEKNRTKGGAEHVKIWPRSRCGWLINGPSSPCVAPGLAGATRNILGHLQVQT